VNGYEYKSPIYNTAEFLTLRQDRTNASLCAGNVLKNNDIVVKTGMTFRMTVMNDLGNTYPRKANPSHQVVTAIHMQLDEIPQVASTASMSS